MNVMRFTIIDEEGVVSFVAPWNVLKALTASCSTKPAPERLETLLEVASKYDTGLKKYVLDNLSIFDENHAKLDENGTLNPLLEKQLNDLLESKYESNPQANRSTPSYKSAFGEVEDDSNGETEIEGDAETNYNKDTDDVDGENAEITYEELAKIQREILAQAESYHPVFRVTDANTRERSQQPAGAGLIIFNLKAKRIIQVQNSFAPLLRSDRGRYHENGRPTERLYFYRLPSDWSIVP